MGDGFAFLAQDSPLSVSPQAQRRARASAQAPAICLHCGSDCGADAVRSADRTFCCQGCEAVYDLLHARGLDAFYACPLPPGVPQRGADAARAALADGGSRYAALDDPTAAARLVSLDDAGAPREGALHSATFSVPDLHCASCLWLIERLWQVDEGIVRTEVDLPRRTVHVWFRPDRISARGVAERLASVGYAPSLDAEAPARGISAATRRLYLELGLAGFAFGNIMLLSVPRYANGAPLEDGFQRLFDTLNVALATPVLLFSASRYFKAAWAAVARRRMTMDVPIVLGLSILFLRSAFDIFTRRGEGYFDSFTGLVFFLLVAALFQRKAFDRLAFDRTFRSFLPLSVRVETPDGLVSTPIDRLRPGDRIRVRPREIVPADARLLDDAAAIDQAFLTGESRPLLAQAGDIVRAGARAAERTLRLEILRAVEHSQLARLWSHPAFARVKRSRLTDLSTRFAIGFTLFATALAAIGAIAWWPDADKALHVATTVLIIACPCALTLAAPAALGTAMEMLGRRGLYLKNPDVVLDLARITAIAFDKTGTLTSSAFPSGAPTGVAPMGSAMTSSAATSAAATSSNGIHDSGSERAGARAAAGAAMAAPEGLSADEWRLVRRLASESVHPISRAMAAGEPVAGRVDACRDLPGRGMSGRVDGHDIVFGHAAFVAHETGLAIPELWAPEPHACGGTLIAIDGRLRGRVRLVSAPRAGVVRAVETLARTHDVWLLSGDTPGDAPHWRATFGDRMAFRQSPEDKLASIRARQAAGRRVAMVGDGLNDAGALAAADVGIAVSDETACMAPACDAILAGDRVASLPRVLAYARRARQVLIACFLVSAAYNALGLTLALTGRLTPLAAAILMPVSSLTILGLAIGAMRGFARALDRATDERPAPRPFGAPDPMREAA